MSDEQQRPSKDAPGRPGPDPERLKIDGATWDEAVRKVLKQNDPPKKRVVQDENDGEAAAN